jgi:TatD DNase family protein
MHFIDVHSHQYLTAPHTITVVNVHEGFSALNDENYFTAGLHPYHIKDETASGELEKLKVAATKNNVIAIGECGLDKVCGTDFNLQHDYFRQQIELAKIVKKPLIIHCVRAYDEVLSTIKSAAFDLPVIFHGFNKSKQLAQQLLDEGYYLSFGKYILESRTSEIAESIPVERLFLETDNSSVPIDVIYRAAGESKKTSVEFLCEQIADNFRRVFRVPIFTADE